MKAIAVWLALVFWMGVSIGSAFGATGVASVYCDKHVAWHSARMHCKQLTVAHRTLKFGTHVKITYKSRSIEAVVTDRGPYVRGRIIDLSTGGAKALHLPGLGRVTVTVIKGGSHGISSPSPVLAGPVRVEPAPEPAPAVVNDTVTEPLPKINRQSVGSPMVSSTAVQQEAPMDWAGWVLKGLAVFGGLSLAWSVGKYGVSALGTKVSSAFSVAKTDFQALEARVKALEGPSPPAPVPVPAAVVAAKV